MSIEVVTEVERGIEVIVAAIGAGAALIGAIVGGAVSFLATKANLKATSRQIEIDHLRRIESHLESFLQKWESMIVDVSGAMNRDPIISRFIGRFLSRVGLFMTIAHHFPRELEEELSSLSKEVNGYILTAKTGGAVDQYISERAIQRMETLDTELPQAIREKLRQIQSAIAALLKNK